MTRLPLPRLGFGSLHTRLLVAFVAIIFLTLLAAGSAGVWAVQRYRTQLAVDHLSDLSIAASMASRQLEREEARPDEIAAFIYGSLGRTDTRVLVLDMRGRVVAERAPDYPSGEPVFLMRQLELPAAETLPQSTGSKNERRVPFATRPPVWTVVAPAPGGPHILITPRYMAYFIGEPRGQSLERFVIRQPEYRIVLAVPEQSLASAWRELAPSLFRTALIAILASVAASLWLTRSIAGPLRQITRAAQAMSRGELRQTIPVRGRDEVAQLATAFNTMSHEVERSHSALRAFLANASHELRTPLTSIQGFSQALVDNALVGAEGATEAGKIINEEAERMRRLVEDLLYLSRVESTELPATRDEVNVASLLREALRRLDAAAEVRDWRLTYDLPDSLTVIGDADELDHLFGNLLDNAGKYTPDGEAIAVTGRLEDGHVVVTVHNTGSLIPADDLPHVFERFFRVDKSRARGVEGSGLGLAIAFEVAERHGGEIRAASDPTSGTSFTVRLPHGEWSEARSAERSLRGRNGRAALPAAASAG